MAKRKFKKHPKSTPAASGKDAAANLSASPGAGAGEPPEGARVGAPGAPPPAGPPPAMGGDAMPDMSAVKASRRYGGK